MSKRILQIGFLVMAVTSLAGCLGNEDSDEFEEDVQSLDGPIENNDPDRYRGRVMNGELENALVWLDMDGDGVFDSDEPGAFSDDEGRFELDVSGLKRDKADSADLDPRDFPLMSLAIPGLTENSRTGAIDRAFFLAAPAGVELITPFTTMAETWRRLQDIEDPREGVREAGTEITRRVSAADEPIGVYSDYLVSGAERVPFYAQAFRRMIQAQIPDELNTDIARGSSAESVDDLVGTGIPEDSLSSEDDLDMDVIGTILVDQSEPLLNEVDEVIDTSGGTDGLQLPDLKAVTTVDADLSNPWLLRKQTLYLPVDGEDKFSEEDISDDVRRAGIISHDYSLGTTLRRATSRGHFAPSMEPVIRMASEKGRVSDLGPQPGLDFDLDDPVEESVDSDGSADERFVFDWSLDGDLARLQSPRLETIGLGDLDDYDREDGDRIYRKSASEGERVTAMERILGDDEDDVDYEIEESDGVLDDIGRAIYSVSIGENVDREPGTFTECKDQESGFEADNDRVINAKQEIEVTGDDSATSGTETLYGHLREDDEEGARFRILMREFVADSGNDEDNWRWEIEYYDDRDNGELLVDDQPDLILSMRLVEDSDPFNGGDCDSESEERSLSDSSIDAFIAYEHIPFTQYLEEIGTRD